MRIPFYKPSIGTEEIDEVVAALRSGWLTTGPRTKQFEREFAAHLKHQYAVAVNSCTAGLHLALEAIGLKAGQGVVVPTMTFAATAEVVRYFNARPILADCRAEDFNLDVADAERKIQSALAEGQAVAAIIPAHYGGQIGDVAGVQELARRFNLKIVEDAAHCCPAYYKTTDYKTTGPQDHGTAGPLTADHEDGGRRTEDGSRRTEDSYAANGWKPVGASADISCFSFYANKCITTGEGGMACTNSEEYADRMRIMSLHGISRDAWKRFTAEGSWYYEIIAPGFKYNMTDIAAAIGIHQLRKADEMHRKRTEWAELYSSLLGGIEELILPRQQPNRVHSWHLYVIRVKLDKLNINRAEIIDALKKAGIGTSVHWMPLHMHPYYRETYGYKPEDFPVAAGLYPQLITLPLYPDMSEEDVRHVCDSIKDILSVNIRSELAGLATGRQEEA